MESHNDIEECAALWLARREEPAWTAADESELKAWLDASIAHKIAFVRLEAGWDRARRLKALGAGGQIGVVPPAGQWHTTSESISQHSVGREHPAARAVRFLSPRVFAASILVAVVTSMLGLFLWSTGPTYETPVGGTASVPMRDGSSITLNTDSAVRIALSATQRQVRLDHGEAFFEVAKDPNRPFVVDAGDKRVVAVGTKFSVRRIDNEVRVLVTEGKVRIEDASAPMLLFTGERQGSGSEADPASSAGGQPSAAGRSERRVFVSAGGIARASGDDILVRQDALPEIENYLSWRSGYLVFEETPLSDAVAEFNRYNERKIVIADPQVAAVRIGGKFRATNVDVFVRLLTDGYPIDADITDDRIVFRDRRSP